MAGSIVISQLAKRYARLLGAYNFADRFIEDVEGLEAIKKATAQIDEYKSDLKAQMSDIAGSIRQFDPAFKIAAIKPIRPKQQLFANGSISKIIYAILREEACPLKTREISKIIAERMELPQEERVLIHFDNIVNNTLIRRLGTFVEADGEPRHWSLIPPDRVRIKTSKSDS